LAPAWDFDGACATGFSVRRDTDAGLVFETLKIEVSTPLAFACSAEEDAGAVKAIDVSIPESGEEAVTLSGYVLAPEGSCTQAFELVNVVGDTSNALSIAADGTITFTNSASQETEISFDVEVTNGGNSDGSVSS